MRFLRLTWLVVGVWVIPELYHGLTIEGPKIDTDYTPKEVESLVEFHNRVDDILIEDYMKTDEYLLPFLRAKSGNLDKAERLLKGTMKWWAETNAGNLLNEEFPTLKRQCPYKVDFVDRDGRPVIMMYFGRWNLRNVLISGQRAQLLRYFDQMLERATDEARKIRKEKQIDVNRFSMLCDLNAYSLTTHGCLNCVPLILDFARHLETHYPGRAVRIYAINSLNVSTAKTAERRDKDDYGVGWAAPRLFIPVFELIKPLMSETTAEGFKAFGADKREWQQAVLDAIPEDQLPREYGGTGKKKPDKSNSVQENNDVTA